MRSMTLAMREGYLSILVAGKIKQKSADSVGDTSCFFSFLSRFTSVETRLSEPLGLKLILISSIHTLP